MIVGFTGTRQGMTRQQRSTLRQDLNRLKLAAAEMPKPPTLVHGDCIGADEDAHDLAYRLGFDIRIRPCNIEELRAHLGQDAFGLTGSGVTIEKPLPPIERNRLIALDCHLLIATPFRGREELRSGTWATIRYARRFGKAIEIIKPDGSTIRENF